MIRALFFTLLAYAALSAQTGVLKKVVDGDTLYFSKEKCRIAYIDTPESFFNAKAIRDAESCSPLTPGTIVAMGKESTAHAATLVNIGQSYRYDVIDKDRYGRSICIVYLGDHTFNEQMVADGFAVPYERYLPKEQQRKYHQLLKSAKMKRAGLWRHNAAICAGK